MLKCKRKLEERTVVQPWNHADARLHNMMLKNLSIDTIETRNSIINECTESGIFVAVNIAALNNNSVYLNMLIELRVCGLDVLHFMTMHSDQIPRSNQEIIKNHFKFLILKETTLSIDNYKYHHYAAVILDTTTPSVNNSLEIVARGFKATGLEKTKHIMSILFKYLEKALYVKLFKAVIEKEDNQSLANYGGQLLNKTYEFFLNAVAPRVSIKLLTNSTLGIL